MYKKLKYFWVLDERTLEVATSSKKVKSWKKKNWKNQQLFLAP